MGCHVLLQGIFLSQGLNPDLLWLLPCTPAGRRGLAAGRGTRHGHPHEGAGGRAKERGKEGAGLGAAVEGEKDVPLTLAPAPRFSSVQLLSRV